jgi:YD repeat-containing protein
MGMVIKKQTDAQRAISYKEWEDLTYDQLGRMTTRRRAWGGNNPGSAIVQSFYYDSDGGSPHPSCGLTLNTQGRLRRVSDWFGRTWYQYDAEGRVLKENP